jgi:hypothetical protein
LDRDLAKQIKEWRKSGERIVLVMDVNDDPLTSRFYQQIQKEQMGLEEFTHKCWGPTPPYTHISGSSPIDVGYKSSEIEIVHLGMLTFAESPGNHRSFIIDISTRSLLGEFRFKICRPVSRRLVTDFSPTIQMWYDRIHAYLQLIRLKEGKASNASNIVRFAKRTNINRPPELSMEELEDGLQFCRIMKAEMRQQAKGLRKVHLRDCLLDAQSKQQNERAKAIKLKLHREESKWMWYLIKSVGLLLSSWWHEG